MPLTKSDTVGTWIKDFKKSDAPQFKGKTDKEKRDMAVAAYLSKKREQKEDNIRSLEDPTRDQKGYKISPKRLNRHLRRTAQDVARTDKNMGEGLDELSKDKYGEYIKHATSDVSRRASRLSTDYSTKALNKLTKRQAGIHKAVDKLTASKHESTEVVEARGEDSKGHFIATDKGAGMTAKGVAAYRRANPGSKLQTAVTGKVKPGSKDAKRRKSFCARMKGMPGPMKDEKGRPTRKAASLKRWRCR